MSTSKPRESSRNPEPSRGDRFGAAVRANYEPTIAENKLLTEVCRLIDLCDTLAAAIDRNGAMVPGSVGQPRVHPAIGQLTTARLALSRLLSTLGLPNSDGETLPTPRAVRARRASAVRWSQPQSGSVASENATQAAMIRWHRREAGNA